MSANNNVITFTNGCTPYVLTVNATGTNATFSLSGATTHNVNLKMSVIAN
jgi:hypothetical protein